MGNAMSSASDTVTPANDAQKLFAAGIQHYIDGKLDDAATCFRRVRELAPTHPETLHLLGLTVQRKGDYVEAIEMIGKACVLDPTSYQYHRSLGVVYQEAGHIEEAVHYWDVALRLEPTPDLYSHMLLCMHYSKKFSKKHIYYAHCKFDANFCKNLMTKDSYTNSKNHDKKLKIGYVSVDFRHHLGGYFLRYILEKFNREQFDIYIYHVDLKGFIMEDGFTAYLRSLPLNWRTHSGDDESLATMIRADGIDILVDLCGHSGGNRLLAFARKPAPIQVTWLGYPNTTGMTAMDYRLVDSVSDPEGEADTLASEKLVRLEGGFLGFSPPDQAPPVASTPALGSGVVTFGTLNRPEKISEDILKVWAEIVKRVPNSRLLLKGKLFDNPGGRGQWERRLQSFGLRPDQYGLMGYTAGYLEHYALIDIALDTFPYNGTITTCDTLWMGVPVVTLAGDRHVARVGASILAHIGLGNLVAATEEEYVGIAAALASDIGRLNALRMGMRERMTTTALGHPNRFILYLEVAYRTMWARWCAGLPPEALWIRMNQPARKN